MEVVSEEQKASLLNLRPYYWLMVNSKVGVHESITCGGYTTVTDTERGI